MKEFENCFTLIVSKSKRFNQCDCGKRDKVTSSSEICSSDLNSGIISSSSIKSSSSSVSTSKVTSTFIKQSTNANVTVKININVFYIKSYTYINWWFEINKLLIRFRMID